MIRCCCLALCALGVTPHVRRRQHHITSNLYFLLLFLRCVCVCVLLQYNHPPAAAEAQMKKSSKVKHKIKKLKIFNDGYLGSHTDEERSEMRYAVRIAERESSDL
jgi:hypothetical protein